jgi:hypothetical protein
MHVDPGDALAQHFHAPGHLLQGTPHADRGQARRPPEPRSVQETDTRARSSSGGYPARGSSTNLKYGLERSKGTR